MIDIILDYFIGFLGIFSILVVIYFVVINSVYLVLIGISFFHIRRQIKEKDVYRLEGLFSSNLYSPISIIAPAYNEEATIVASVKSLLQLRYPNYEVIVVNDGSKDRTIQVLIQEFKLKRVKRYVPLILDHKPIKAIYKSTVYPELVVVDKENGRKADALNAGINVCRNDLFCAIDADCVLEPEVLQNMLKTFIEDDTTIAVGGIVRVANDCVIEGNEIKEVRFPKRFLPRIQVVEYLRAFLFGRVGWDYLDSLLIISGAFGIFDRNAVLKVGGYLHDTVGEDMELVVRLHKYHRQNKIPYRVRFLPEPVCWTEVPEDYKVLSRQRNRWQRGLADTLFRHKEMLFNPKYGRLGIFAVPFFFVFELLAPVVELLGWLVFVVSLLFGLVNWPFALIFLSAAVLFGMVLSISSILCEEFTYRRYPKLKDIMLMILFAFVENFGFRQVHMWWRLKGIVDFLKGNKSWGEMTRKGLGNQSVLQNLDTQKAPDDSDFDSDEVGDHGVDAKSYIDSLDSRASTDSVVQTEEPKKVPLATKLLLTLIIVGVLIVSFWSKMDLINSFKDNSNSIIEQPQVSTGTSNGTTVVLPDSTESTSISDTTVYGNINVSDSVWKDSSYYFISYNTYFSTRAAVLVGDQLKRIDSTQVLMVALRDSTNWSTGIGRYASYAEAISFARSRNLNQGVFEIIRIPEYTISDIIRVFRPPTGTIGYNIVVSENEVSIPIESLSNNLESYNFDVRLREGRLFIGDFRTNEEAYLLGSYFKQAGLVTQFDVQFVGN
jgi:cellulose synthase/poly-beta-1,6-N-acetylglucosamine synthase-like glycosyltransferase